MSAPANANVPWKTVLKKDRLVRWCACGLSAKQPYCDDSHAGTNLLPALYRPAEDVTVALCGCKRTGRPPFCDGAHRKL